MNFFARLNRKINTNSNNKQFKVRYLYWKMNEIKIYEFIYIKQ